MEPELMKEVREDLEKKWTGFCQRIVDGEFNFKDDGSELRAAGGDGGP
jgi:hypothetical protein